MAQDTSLAARRAILTRLKAEAPTSGVIAAASIYPPQTPPTRAWPFIRYGAATQLPWKPTGADGSLIAVAVHSFARGPGEDQASRIGAWVARVLDGAVLDLSAETGFPATARVRHTGNTTLQDPEEADAWHVVTNLEIIVAS
ncbi:DUF3168 domain-containing protein [Sandarakinorhabdus sp. DWP1-3-1]|uniref:DUF3168 domain-containing protein n=1 Tax=Sandarakinorhabdus sp. DWP1-3-1 TaxID=2804627 RepID=UPI003CF86D28